MKLYSALAPWWPLISAPEDYAEEAGVYTRLLKETAAREVRAVLELGSGGGNNASHMKAAFELTLVDPSPAMLDVSRALNRECKHRAGDMRNVRLDGTYDAAFVHDAVCYMATEGDLRDAVDTAFLHLRPGGPVLFAPDFIRETFRPRTGHGGHDGPGRSVRYLEWVTDPDPEDTTYTVDYVVVLREPDGTVRVEYDRHTEGLFSRAHWIRTLETAGFEAVEAVPVELSEPGGERYEVFVGRRPGGNQSGPVR